MFVLYRPVSKIAYTDFLRSLLLINTWAWQGQQRGFTFRDDNDKIRIETPWTVGDLTIYRGFGYILIDIYWYVSDIIEETEDDWITNIQEMVSVSGFIKRGM